MGEEFLGGQVTSAWLNGRKCFIARVSSLRLVSGKPAAVSLLRLGLRLGLGFGCEIRVHGLFK